MLFGLVATSFAGSLVRHPEDVSIPAGDDFEVVDNEDITSPQIMDATVSADGEVTMVQANVATRSDAEANSRKTDDLLQEVEDIARVAEKCKVSKDKGCYDPTRIKTIKDLVSGELIPCLKDTRTSAAKEVTMNLNAIKQCKKNTLDKVAVIKKNTAGAVDKVRTQHAQCRKEEMCKHSLKQDNCDFLKNINVPVTIPNNKNDENAMIEYVKNMGDYFCPNEKKAKECESHKNTYGAHKTKCNQFQNQFESGYCTFATELKDACGDLSSACYNAAKKGYDDHVAATKALVKKWKTEYAALMKISCYVDVWLGDKNTNTASEDKMNKCRSENADTKVMDVDYGTPADLYKCHDAHEKTYPGSPGFVKAEYSSFNDYVQPVTKCLGMSVFEETTFGAKTCSSGYERIMREAVCKQAGTLMGKKWSSKNSWHNIQKGCFSHGNNHIWFNTHSKPNAHPHFSMICKDSVCGDEGWRKRMHEGIRDHQGRGNL
jgi:hypothetical protein